MAETPPSASLRHNCVATANSRSETRSVTRVAQAVAHTLKQHRDDTEPLSTTETDNELETHANPFTLEPKGLRPID